MVECLKLPINEKGKPFPEIRKLSISRRRESIDEAISLDSGENKNNQKITEYYSFRNNSIVVGKPGKEAEKEYKGKLGDNYNDMTPKLLIDGIEHKNNFGFDDIFELLFQISKIDSKSLELIGCILLRAAYMLDHKRNEEGNWRLNLPLEVMHKIEKKIPEIEGIPISALIYLLDVIALNEDVKYFTLGKNDELKEGTGRRNNLLTYCNLIGVLLERVKFSKFAGSFARLPVGISAIAQKATLEVFPMLDPEN